MPDYKDISLSTTRIKQAAPPLQVTLPLKQHVGLASYPIAKPGDSVMAGTKIAVGQNEFSADLHASISGVISEINSEWIRIESDKKDQWEPLIQEDRDWENLSSHEILKRIQDCGIVGMGGRGFPTHLKLKLLQEDPADWLIVNGCESEPFLTSDYVLMLGKSTEILLGINLILKASGAKRCVIAISEDKLEAIELLLSKIRALKFSHIEVKKLPARYPQGSEDQLKQAIFGRFLPQKESRSFVQNVATVFAVYEAIRYRKPLVERVVTVSGHCVVEPQNFWCRIGASGDSLVQSAKGLLRNPSRVVYGGPMGGISVLDLNTPVTKPVSGIVALAPEFINDGKENPCTRCGLCVESCPENLNPEILMRAAVKKNEQLVWEFGLDQCTECGNCAYVCPSKIPLVDIFKTAKANMLHIPEESLL